MSTDRKFKKRRPKLSELFQCTETDHIFKPIIEEI